MALSPQLLQFKSSGVYRLEFDKSVTTSLNVETLRLVVGHSKRGPYNTPVLISNADEFINVFGSIDRSLEKKGMFFHRSAFEALSRGPILALNLNSFTEADKASYASLVSNGAVDSISAVADAQKPYAEFFDTDKFMTPSDAAVLGSVSVDDNHLLHFVNIKQSGITVIVRQAQDVKEFEITAREWYGEGNVPAHLNDFDYVSDYMIDVFVFKGEFNAAQMANDPVYSAYFSADGLNKELLDQFANLRQVTLEAKYTGSLLPGFKDLEGRNLYIESAINNESRRTGLFCAVNEDSVLEGNLDLVGHTYDADQDYELLSHVVKQSVATTEVTLPAGSPFVDPTATTYNVTDSSITSNGGLTNNAVSIDGDVSADFTAGSDYLKLADGSYTVITGVNYNVSQPLKTVLQTAAASSLDAQYAVTGAGTFEIYDGLGTPAVPGVTTSVSTDTLTLSNYDATAISSFVAGEYLEAAIAGEYVKILSVSFDGAANETTIVAEGNIAASYDGIDTTNAAVDVEKYAVSQGRVIEEAFAGATYAAAGSLFTLTYGAGLAPASISLSAGDYVQAEETGRLAKVKRIAKSGDVYTVYCDVNVPAAWGGEYVKSFENASSVYKTFVLSGAQLADKEISGALSVLNGGSGLYDALVDKDMIEFRYIVDTFASHDSTGILNKRQLSNLAKDRQNASAILNAPTVADFKASANPSFTDANGTFKTQYIADGGNLDKNPTALYTLPSINEGANYAFYYGPGLLVSDNGKDIVVPAAAYVSNNYIDKYSSALPWSIVAGPRRGVVSGTNVKGVEYAFDKADRDILEPFGINPIVFQRGVGLTILGNKTAQQSVKSALSSAHVREGLIYIQEGIADILKDYVFEFNNTQTRLEIKTLADSFMESVKADGGVYDFKNIMDQTNNTDDVIDNNFGIIDTYVEPVKGLEIVVHRTTILNTGEIQSGNFN
jgi:hypothetical protein